MQRFGAEVTLIRRDIVGGGGAPPRLRPLKVHDATGGALSFARRLDSMGLANVETG